MLEQIFLVSIALYLLILFTPGEWWVVTQHDHTRPVTNFNMEQVLAVTVSQCHSVEVPQCHSVVCLS